MGKVEDVMVKEEHEEEEMIWYTYGIHPMDYKTFCRGARTKTKASTKKQKLNGNATIDSEIRSN